MPLKFSSTCRSSDIERDLKSRHRYLQFSFFIKINIKLFPEPAMQFCSLIDLETIKIFNLLTLATQIFHPQPLKHRVIKPVLDLVVNEAWQCRYNFST